MKVSVRSIAVIALMSVGLVAPAAASQAASQPTAGASISPVIHVTNGWFCRLLRTCG
jgi:hypothetical protein